MLDTYSRMAEHQKDRVTDACCKSLLDFRPTEKPHWRAKEQNIPDSSTMLTDIVKYMNKWKSLETFKTADSIEKAKWSMESMFLFSVNFQEEHGLGTKEATEEVLIRHIKNVKVNESLSNEETEVKNIFRAYKFFKDLLDKTKTDNYDNYLLLEPDILRDAHELILAGVDLGQRTSAGSFSDTGRYTTYKGKTYHYNQKYKDFTTEESVQIVIDHYNPLIEYAKSRPDDLDKVLTTFKAAAYLVFQMLDVHPFSDGNGRLCRLLASYVLMSIAPFPTTVYNVWSKSSKEDYVDSLIEARESKNRNPCLLTSMMIECNWFFWKKFFESLNLDAHQ